MMTKYLSTAGDIYLKYGGKTNLTRAYELYDESNKTLEAIVGKAGIDFIYSMTDIGDVYLEQKSLEEAEAFYTHSKSEVEKYYGADSIFKARINSSLIEVYSAMGNQNREKGYLCAMENIDLAQKIYGDMSIFCLSFYMSGMSANVQKGTHQIGENILNKMLRVLETSEEIAKGNQYFFLASVLLGVV